MLLQLGSLFSGAISGIGSLFSGGGGSAAAGGGIFSQLGSALTTTLTEQVLPQALNVGSSVLTDLAKRELGRDQARAQNDAIKAGIRQAFTATSPVVAPSQGPVFSGGSPTGTPFSPPTVFPPSTQPIPQQLQINPNFLLPAPKTGAFSSPAVTSLGEPVRLAGLGGGAPVQQQLVRQPGISGLGDVLIDPIRGLDSLRRQMGAGVVAPTATRNGAMSNGTTVSPLRGIGTLHRYTRNRDNTGSQIFICNPMPQGPNMIPIEQAPALGIEVNGATRYRFDQIKGEFTKLKRRRLNPANTRAFMRAGRRIEAMERIARALFSEKRKARNATVKRKVRRKKK